MLQGIQGVRNISDDIIEFGKTQADHDAALQAVFQKMRENNLTVNLAKCLLNQSSIDIFGHHFSADGISADDKKVVKTKRFLRDSVWFLGIDRMVEEVVNGFLPCQAANYDPKPVCEPLHMSTLPLSPWEELSMDFCGPFPSGDYLLVVTDDFSRYPEVEILRSTSAKAVIPHLDSIFARRGFPDKVGTDNGPPFHGESFQMFATQLGFTHHRITPEWPRANGEAGRLMKTLEKAIRTAVIQGKS